MRKLWLDRGQYSSMFFLCAAWRDRGCVESRSFLSDQKVAGRRRPSFSVAYLGK